MNYDELKKMGAVLTEVKLSYRYQQATYSLSAEADDTIVLAAYKHLVGLVDEAMGEVSAPQTVSEPVRVPDQQDGETEGFTVESVLIEFSPSGEKGAKVKGGKYKKFGVRVWPEVLAAEGISLDALNAGEYPKTTLTGKTATVLMEGGKAKKVIGFK